VGIPGQRTVKSVTLGACPPDCREVVVDQILPTNHRVLRRRVGLPMRI
jgi:hypothetical protein